MAEAPNVGTPGRKAKSRKVGAAAKSYRKVEVADREELEHPGGSSGANRNNATAQEPNRRKED